MLIEPEFAVMVTVPRLRPVSRPLTVIDATVLLEELQFTVLVMFCVVPSENVPVAVNCCKSPKEIEALTGVTAIELKLALVTVRVALEEILPEVAVMVQVPGATALASPSTPFKLILATVRSDEVQFTEAVTFCVVPSVNVPAAVN